MSHDIGLVFSFQSLVNAFSPSLDCFCDATCYLQDSPPTPYLSPGTSESKEVHPFPDTQRVLADLYTRGTARTIDSKKWIKEENKREEGSLKVRLLQILREKMSFFFYGNMNEFFI